MVRIKQTEVKSGIQFAEMSAEKMGRKEKKEEKMTGEFNLCCLIFFKKISREKRN